MNDVDQLDQYIKHERSEDITTMHHETAKNRTIRHRAEHMFPDLPFEAIMRLHVTMSTSYDRGAR